MSFAEKAEEFYIVTITLRLKNTTMHRTRWRLPVVHKLKGRRSAKVAIGYAIDWAREELTKEKIKGRSEIDGIEADAFKVWCEP